MSADGSGRSLRRPRDLEVDRKTVTDYRDIALKHGWLEGEVPDAASIAALLKTRVARQVVQTSTVEPFRTLVIKLRK